MVKFERTKSGIIIPRKKKKPVQCAYCPNLIWRHNEAEGRIHEIDGKPACARCRILKSKSSRRILKDKGRYEVDKVARNNFIEKTEKEKMIQIAIASQNRAPEVKIKK